MLGKYVFEGRPMSNGLKGLLWKLMMGKSLNTLSMNELRYCQLMLNKVYEFTLNMYLLREAVTNCAVRDDKLLSRKVPIEYWKMVYDTCERMNIHSDILEDSAKRANLWLFINSNPKILKAMFVDILQQIGISQNINIDIQNLSDGNFLFNMGSVIPSRLLMILGFCLVFWGIPKLEPWVRKFVSMVFILYMMLLGHIVPKYDIFEESVSNNYSGLSSLIWKDIMSLHGAVPSSGTMQHMHELDYIFIFNNSILLNYSSGHR
ncbi:unknown [Suid gammaherpesvirus 3]|uniref:Protein UL79 n=1 Tax=Suid gammaherpesvirus 3 TaxID=1960249 RepID=Q8JJR3_9GAMA|nr:unknown [Porcine lymphotropic herpesvirus 1]AAM22118.1 unknown [Porcine lymphotropic herpesvirus 1]